MMNKNHRSFLAALGATAFLGGCDLLEVDNPNALVQADIEKVEAAAAAVNGAQALAASGIGGIYAAFSTVGDEITWIGSRDAWNELNQGTPNNSGNEFADGSFPGIAQARWMTNFAVGLIEGHVAENAGNAALQSDLARANLYAGVVYSAIAQMFDDFAFSDRTEPGPLIGEANMHTVFDQAIAYYSAAMQGGGETGDAGAGRSGAGIPSEGDLGSVEPSGVDALQSADQRFERQQRRNGGAVVYRGHRLGVPLCLQRLDRVEQPLVAGQREG